MTQDLRQLRGHIRGNQRLRRRVDAMKARVARLEYLIGRLVTAADRRGYGDDQTVLTAARAIGWHRLADDIAAEVRRRAEELQP